jgi:hypothetical protein
VAGRRAGGQGRDYRGALDVVVEFPDKRREKHQCPRSLAIKVAQQPCEALPSHLYSVPKASIDPAPEVREVVEGRRAGAGGLEGPEGVLARLERLEAAVRGNL